MKPFPKKGAIHPGIYRMGNELVRVLSVAEVDGQKVRVILGPIKSNEFIAGTIAGRLPPGDHPAISERVMKVGKKDKQKAVEKEAVSDHQAAVDDAAQAAERLSAALTNLLNYGMEVRIYTFDTVEDQSGGQLLFTPDDELRISAVKEFGRPVNAGRGYFKKKAPPILDDDEAEEDENPIGDDDDDS